MTNNRTLKILILIFDFLFLWSSYNLSYFFRFNETSPDLILNLSLFKVFITCVFFNYLLDTYSLIEHGTLWQNLMRFLFSSSLASLFVIIQIYLFSESPSNEFGRGVLIGAFLGYTLFSGAFRYWEIRRLRSIQKKEKWLFIGEPHLVNMFYKDYEPLKPVIGEVVYLENPLSEHLECAIKPADTWSNFKNFSSLPWRGIVVCSLKKIPDDLVNQLFDLKVQGKKIYSLTDFYQKYFLKVPVYFLDRSWLALTQGFSLLHNQFGLRIKRISDILGVLILLPLIIPMLSIVTIFLILTSGFPIIFKQKRTGKNGREFIIYKLRTMTKNAEKDGIQWAQKNDSRVTFFGKILRKTRIDELPQLYNVLIGDMSFIGPRPERPEFNITLEKNIPHYNLRHVVRPGISGWAQVKYPYGASEEDSRQKLQYDLFYIKNYSMALDIYIIFKTIKVMLRGAGSR